MDSSPPPKTSPGIPAPEAIGLGAVYLLLFSILEPWLIFSGATVTGGDTGTHHYLAHYLGEHLLPQGELRGWSPDWYAGFPLFYFYFPLPYLAIVLLDTIIPYNIAFSLMTVAGTFALPAAAWWSLGKMGADRMMRLLGAAAAGVFLVQENYSILGGNIASTLAGEFSFSISLALCLVFIGMAADSINAGSPRIRLVRAVRASTIMALAGISHAIPAAFTGLAGIGLTLRKHTPWSPGAAARLAIVAGSSLLGLGLVAFWAFPLIGNMGWTANMSWAPNKDLALLAPLEITAALPFVLVAVVAALRRRQMWSDLFLWQAVISAALWWLMPEGAILNTRFLPFYYFAYLMLAAYGIAVFIGAFSRRPFRRRQLIWLFGGEEGRTGIRAAAVIVIVICVVFGSTRAFLDDWARWNYSGYEAKKGAAEYRKIMATLRALPHGRVFWEYTADNEKYGTPRALELIPSLTEQPTMEGLLIESALTAPFHFINQSELSQTPTRAVRGIDYPEVDTESGLKHMRLFNVRYVMAHSAALVVALDRYPGSRELKTFGSYTLFEIPTDGYVTVPKYEPLLAPKHIVRSKDFMPLALDWYRDTDLLEAPIVWDVNGTIKADPESARPLRRFDGTIEHTPLVVPDATGGRPHVVSKVDDGRISFTTDQVGRAHYIKVSYFPNWRVEGAYGPFLAAPSFMLVVPFQRNVTLTFSRTRLDHTGLAVSLGSVASALGLLTAMRVRGRRDETGAEAGAETGAPSSGEAEPEEPSPETAAAEVSRRSTDTPPGAGLSGTLNDT